MKRIAVFLIVFAFSCNYDLQYYKDIPGDWSCSVSQLMNGPVNGDTIKFTAERSYTLLRNGKESFGVFKIDGNKIHYGEVGTRVKSFRVVEMDSIRMVWESLDDQGVRAEFSRIKE